MLGGCGQRQFCIVDFATPLHRERPLPLGPVQQLERAVSAVPGAEPAFLIGDPAGELVRESESAQLMVIGSRNYGPAPAVLLGDVSGRVAAIASCPVLIVPQGCFRSRSVSTL